MHRLVSLIVAGALSSPVWPAGPEPRTLFIAIDAVPFEIMREVATRPESSFYASLEGPLPVISTFPSSTSLALGAILEPMGVARSPGYEAKHYDWEKNAQTGGGLRSYEPFPFRKFFDWKVGTLWRKAMSALRPMKASSKDIRQSLEAFEASEAQSFFVYYDTPDLAGHLKSPQGMKPILTELEQRLQELRAASPERPFRVVLFSDHGLAGGAPLQNVRKDVKRTLREAGFRPRKRLQQDRDVVFVPFGLLSSFIAYTRPGREDAVATVVSMAEGVDLCAFREARDWRIASRRGNARIRFRAAPPSWSYAWSGEEPLGLGETLEGRFARGEWIDDDELFVALRDHEYPDAFHRIVRAFDLVENPASLACSVEPGYMYGSKLTEVSSRLSVGRLEWTHGSLAKGDSLGFVMTDVPDWDAEGAVRFDDVLTPFRALAPTRPADSGGH